MSSLTTFVEGIINEDIPRKYKRSAFIYTLLNSMDNNLSMSGQTLKKIERLFETGTITTKEIIIGKMISKYLWNDVVKVSNVVLNDNVMSIDDAISKCRKEVDQDTQMEYMIKIVNTLYNTLPDYIRYGTEKLMKKDIFSTIAYSIIGSFKTS